MTSKEEGKILIGESINKRLPFLRVSLIEGKYVGICDNTDKICLDPSESTQGLGAIPVDQTSNDIMINRHFNPYSYSCATCKHNPNKQ